MRPDFIPSPAQLAALQLSGAAEAEARASWQAGGRFWLEPQPGSEAQAVLGRGLVVADPDAPGELVVVYHIAVPLEEVEEEPSVAGLYFTVTAGGDLWLIEGNVEWTLPTLDEIAVDLVKVGAGLGHLPEELDDRP